ncbi:hypothetical protein NPIL_265801 [Nephila pilipes]|uniref:Uncharacterized protein n=1 Tax=Nephila pilipes TaxID=299642 RepID=A0A8X6TIG2_NEPPI|nr:hypothetical protein NPIL_265801 [Nephila pilipes]
MDTLISVTNCHDLISKIEGCLSPIVQDKRKWIVNHPKPNYLRKFQEMPRSELVNTENKKLVDENYVTANLFIAELDPKLKFERKRRTLKDKFEEMAIDYTNKLISNSPTPATTMASIYNIRKCHIP